MYPTDLALRMAAASGSLGTRVARLVLSETLRVRRGENVTIEAWSEALPWAVPFVAEARRLGARPMMLYEDEGAFWEALESGGSRATGEVGHHEWSALRETDAYVFFFGPAEWPRYDTLPDRKTVGVAAYNSEWYRRAAKARLRGARMYLGRTSRVAAERWKVDLRAWRNALLRASLVSPERMRQLGEKVGRRLRTGDRVRVTHPNGTDLRFRLGRFPIQLDDGLVDARDLRLGNNMTTMPGGAIGVAVDHTSARGTITGNHTVYPSSGPASGLEWTFRDGHLKDYAYRQGGREFAKIYSAAPRQGRDRLGYFSIGLNSELSGCPQLEDQELGAVMVRLGGNSFAGGKNPSPFGSWLVLTGADLTVDDRPVLRKGEIV